MVDPKVKEGLNIWAYTKPQDMYSKYDCQIGDVRPTQVPQDLVDNLLIHGLLVCLLFHFEGCSLSVPNIP